MDKLLATIEDWVIQLEEGIVCDPDEGDPIYCLEEVELIIKKMKIEVMANKIKLLRESVDQDNKWCDETKENTDGE